MIVLEAKGQVYGRHRSAWLNPWAANLLGSFPNAVEGFMKVGARQAIEASIADDLLPGEIIFETFGAQTGPNPMLAALMVWIVILGSKYRTVTLTNHGLLVHSANGLRPFKAKELLNRLPHNTLIGPVDGLWSKVELGDEQIWIHRRFHKDVTAMNDRLSPDEAATTSH